MSDMLCAGLRGLVGIIVVVLLLGGSVLAQQPMSAEQQAEVALIAAVKAQNEGNLPFAAQRYSEVLQKFGATRSAVAARFGLGQVLLLSPEQDFAKAVESLNGPANDGGFAQRGQALYHLAVAQRGLGLRELEQARQKPNEAPQRQQTANQKFSDAQRAFSTARDWFQGQKENEWAARARADQAEMELRLNRIKEARATTEPFLKDAGLAKNPHRPLGMYYHGLACFLDNDLVVAGRTLNQLAPFADPAFGLHARYLVGRVLQLSGENAEASVHYEAVLKDYESAKKDAATALQQPERFKNNPFEKSRLLALAQGPVPEYVAGSAFHGATISYEAGKFAEAQGKLSAFLKAYPEDALAPDATLRLGFCLVQQKQFNEAVKLLTPLLEKTPRLADQAQFWLGKAQFALALQVEPKNEADRKSKFAIATESLRNAAEKARQLANSDPLAKSRSYEILFELGDAHLAFLQPKESLPHFEKIWNEQGLPHRREEVLVRIAQAQGFAGNLDGSENRCQEFRRTFPQSVLTPVILFRQAENAYARAQEAQARKAGDVKTKFDDAAARYKEVVSKYPEFDRVHFARYGQALCLAHLGEIEAAAAVLEAIPAPERTGELSGAAYLLGDCLIRLAPIVAEDALQENQIREKLTSAASLLDGFTTANPQTADTPAALLKLGFCYKRLGITLADPNERNQTLQKARESLEKVEQNFGKTPFAPQATLEKAKIKALQGDRGGAMNDLRSLLNNPAAVPMAPLAAMNLATFHREQNQAAEAAKVLQEARNKYEADLARDPARAEWLHLLRYQHGVAILETNKPAEARVLFEQIVREATTKSIAVDAALRSGQARAAEGRKLLQDGINARNQAGNDQNRKNQAQQLLSQGRAALIEAAENLVLRAKNSRDTHPKLEARARMLYDAAWVYRTLAQDEVTEARDTLRKTLHDKLIQEAKAKLPSNAPVPNIPVPAIDLSQVPEQKSELNAVSTYKLLIDEFPEQALGVEARFELAELRAERAQHDDTIKLLKEALDVEPVDRPVPSETLERIRLRLGAALSAKKDHAAALIQFETVAGNPKSPHLAQALYRAGETLFAQGEYAPAVEKLKPFLEKNEFHSIGGISDRALLRLGFAQLAEKKPDLARKALETLLQRFGNGNPYAPEARYGIGLSLAAENRPDDALRAYEQVIASTRTDVAARAQLAIGLVRRMQGKHIQAAEAFMVVDKTYDYPEIGYSAELEAARSYRDAEQADKARPILEKLLKAVPAESTWAKAAQELLAMLAQK